MKHFILILAVVGALSSAHALDKDRGGGNIIDNKLVESYQRDITTIPGYKEVVVPVLTSLQKKVPQFGEFLISQSQSFSFYLIPANLHPLAEEVTGLPFPSDQTAIQSSNEVWVDSGLFAKMARSEQGKLLLHEIILHAAKTTWHQADSRDVMAVVRATTEYLAKHFTDDDVSLSEQLLGIANWPYYMLTPASEIAAAEKAKIIEQEQNLAKQRIEREANLPTFKVIAEGYYGLLTQFCQENKDVMPLSYPEWEQNMGFFKKRKIERILMGLYKSVYETETAARLDIISLDDYGKSGGDVRYAQTHPYSTPIQVWIKNAIFDETLGRMNSNLLGDNLRIYKQIRENNSGNWNFVGNTAVSAGEFCSGDRLSNLRMRLNRFYNDKNQMTP